MSEAANTATWLDPRLNAYRPDLADSALKGLIERAHYTDAAPFMVQAPTAPMHKEPDSHSMMTSEALLGEVFKVFEQKDGWSWGQLETDGYVGYVPSRLLRPHNKAQAPDHYISAPRTFVYPDADLRLPALCALSMASRIKVTGRAVTRGVPYTRVLLPDGRRGAVIQSHIRPIDKPLSDWVGVAERFVHTPYLWGGRSGFGVDCSGLVQTARLMAGLDTPRDSDMQTGEGEALALTDGFSSFRRGDLVFWPGHVGIMLDEARLIHASGYHMAVAIEPLQAAEARIARHYGKMSGAWRMEDLRF